MELKIDKGALDALLAKIYPIVPTKSTMPALSNILLEAKGGKIYASATDLETSATAIGTAEILKEGVIALNGKDLYNLIRELPSVTLEFKVDNLLATIKCGKGKFTMAGMGKEDFPKLSEVDGKRKVTIPCEVLQRAIDKTMFAASTGETTGVLGGGLLDLRQDEFRLVATDGHKLVLFKSPMEGGKIASLLVASKVWREISRLSSGVEITFEESKVGFSSKDMIIVSRLMEGEFPPYEAVIPTDNDKTLLVSKDELALALRRALVFTPEISRLIKFTLKSNTLLIEASSETGEAKEEVLCKYEGEELEIAYNGSYLLSILGKVDSDEVRFLFKDPTSAAIITSSRDSAKDSAKEQQKGEEITYLLMPIRLE